MSKARNGLPSPALVVAALALIAALAGSAVAVTVGSNDVGAKQLKKVTVRTAQSPAFPSQLTNNGDPEWRTVTVNCTKGEIAVNGGLDWNLGDQTDLTALYTGEVAPILRKGEAVGYNVAGAADENAPAGQQLFFTAYAECLKK